jgi:hypothetical protein
MGSNLSPFITERLEKRSPDPYSGLSESLRAADKPILSSLGENLPGLVTACKTNAPAAADSSKNCQISPAENDFRTI